MPELRYNQVTNAWVIIATDRAKRPEDFSKSPFVESKESEAKCVFCPGHEDKTPPEVFAVRNDNSKPNAPGWKVRVIPNAFPALKPEGEPTIEKSKTGFLKMNGVGKHEVIIETTDHHKIIALLDNKEVEDIVFTYRQRYCELMKDARFKSIVIFKNHGPGAGTSLRHPHSQVVAAPVVPNIISERIKTADEYFKEKRSCLYCDMIKNEKDEGERVVMETKNFIVFEPFASRMPFETWIYPLNHSSDFETINDDGCRELAEILKKTLWKLYKTLNNPDFNYAIYSSPCEEKNTSHFHWNLKIFPRVSTPAGFELGSGMSINPVIPEIAAKYLREAA